MGLRRRTHNRYTRRLEAEFKVGQRTLRGTSSNLSERGLFVRTISPLTVGSYVEVTITLPDDSQSNVAGIVRRAIKTSFTNVKNGMGIELTKWDENFTKILRTLGDNELEEEPEVAPLANNAHAIITPHTPEPAPEEFLIVACASCGAKNKVRTERLGAMIPKCGRCKTPLSVQ